MRNLTPFAPQIQKLRDAIRTLEAKQEAVAKWPVLLAESGLNWKEFCAEYNFHQAQVSGYINGNIVPGWDAITAINTKLQAAAALAFQQKRRGGLCG